MHRLSLAPPSFDPTSDEDSASDGEPASPVKKGKGIKAKQRFSELEEEPETEGQNSIVPTAFDSYFVQTAAVSRTSANVFSNLVPPLSQEEYASAIAPHLYATDIWTQEWKKTMFLRFVRELDQGFNLLMYGYGSKRTLLNDFALDSCSKRGHVVVANGFQSQFSFKDLLSSIERVPELSSIPLASSSVENQVKRINEFFSEAPDLYIVIHNIDSPAFRASRAKSCLALMALNPQIHIVASIDKLQAPLIWSSSEIFARKKMEEEGVQEEEGEPVSQGRGFAWLWHDLTTLMPYDVELSHADRSSIAGIVPRKGAAAAAGIGTTAMTETAAVHILASVTQKAKKLFTMMCEKQLQSTEAAGSGTGDPGVGELQQYGITSEALFMAAREQLIVSQDTAFRALLSEFRDHGLVLSAAVGGAGAQGSGAEMLWIPLRKERLKGVLKVLSGESS